MMLLRASAFQTPLADESVQCVVTSPPYWGLRAYAGEQASMWGGEPGHAHEWQSRTGGEGYADGDVVIDPQQVARRAGKGRIATQSEVRRASDLERTIGMQYGHGDMYFRRVEPEAIHQEVRARLEASRARRAVVAEGELTGHVHMLTSEQPLGLVRESDMVAYVLLRDAGLLTHQEHGERVLEPGWYEVGTERDYDPSLYARRVID